MQWVGEAFKKEKIDVMPEQVLLFEDILWRNEIHSKYDLSILTEDDFVKHIVEKHKDELMPILRRRKFEALHACITKDVVGKSSEYSTIHLQRELEEKVMHLQKVNLNDVASKKKMDRLESKLDAVFQFTVVGHGNQVSDAVATKQGATISVVNPTADKQLAEHGLMLMQLQEEFDSFRLESENNMEKQAESKKKKN